MSCFSWSHLRKLQETTKQGSRHQLPVCLGWHCKTYHLLLHARLPCATGCPHWMLTHLYHVHSASVGRFLTVIVMG
jgi:hypothetical protein